MGRKQKIYALYKGEKFITEGTKRQIAKEINNKISTLTFLHSPSNEKRTKGNNHLILIDIEED